MDMQHHTWLELRFLSSNRFREAQGLAQGQPQSLWDSFPKHSVCPGEGILLPPYQAPKLSPVNQHQLLLLSKPGLGRHEE